MPEEMDPNLAAGRRKTGQVAVVLASRGADDRCVARYRPLAPGRYAAVRYARGR
jgi:hypothetical protein